MAPKLTYNLDDTPEDSEVTPGKYLAKVIKVEESTSNSDHPMLIWTWQIEKGDCKGNRITSYTSLQEHMLDVVKRYLKALGYTGKVSIALKDLAGKRAYLIVSKRIIKDKDTGETSEYPRVTKVLLADKFNPPPDDEE